jgi:hypothetical protein
MFECMLFSFSLGKLYVLSYLDRSSSDGFSKLSILKASLMTSHSFCRSIIKWLVLSFNFTFLTSINSVVITSISSVSLRCLRFLMSSKYIWLKRCSIIKPLYDLFTVNELKYKCLARFYVSTLMYDTEIAEALRHCLVYVRWFNELMRTYADLKRLLSRHGIV